MTPDDQADPVKRLSINPDVVLAVIVELNVTQATPHEGTDAEALAIIAIPGPLSTVPQIVLPTVHHPSALLDQLGAQNPTGTTRML